MKKTFQYSGTVLWNIIPVEIKKTFQYSGTVLWNSIPVEIKKTFQYSGTVLWNSIPVEIKKTFQYSATVLWNSIPVEIKRHYSVLFFGTVFLEIKKTFQFSGTVVWNSKNKKDRKDRNKGFQKTYIWGMTTATTMNGKEEITLAELIESKFMKCSKCNKIYQEPKILPCLHTFCKTCIDKISHEVQVTTNKENSVDRLQCPLCQSFIGIPEEGATAFPENPFLSNLLNIHEYKHPKERACDYCKFDGKKTTAEYLCLDCNDDMCSNCSDAHRRTKITRNHSVIPFKQIQNGLYDHDMRSHQARPCTKHGDQMDFFCEICEILICPQCKNEEHDSHRSIKFDDALPRYKRHINGLLEGIQGRIPSIADYVKYLKSYKNSLKESKQKLTENLETQAKTLHQFIDSYKSEMLEKISQKCEAEMTDLETKSNNLEIAGKSLQDNATYLQYLLHHGRSDEILALHRQITFRLTQLANMQIDGITQKLKMGFSTGTNMEQNIKLLFGKLLLENVAVSQKEAGSALENGQLTVTTMLPPLKNSPEVVKTFDAEGSNDFKDVWPTGVSITQSDEVVTVDRDNKKVKVFDKNGNLTLEFVGKPDDKLGSPFDATVLKTETLP
ncbi:TRIM56 [Mytilus coruscus]|uniref:TRIM56 n=1 Tax=Mytilus coruscus TaxID=42192 RepID=A0A6J8D7H6_MYTCO|nr:TRIM56 [Mytilus coruscus]